MIFVLAACNLPALVPPIEDATATLAPESQPTLTNKTGTIIRGQVTLNSIGLAGVKIYKRFNAYPPTLIATTDENGYYESDFIGIPGDEMVSVEAELTGYIFEPPYHYWRHYHGYYETTRDFTAIPVP